MPRRQYQGPPGGLPPQTQLLTDRAVFTDAYAVIPRGCMTDIVTSMLPFWEKSRFWVIARPLSGFAETFSQYIGEVAPGGGRCGCAIGYLCNAGRSDHHNRRHGTSGRAGRFCLYPGRHGLDAAQFR